MKVTREAFIELKNCADVLQDYRVTSWLSAVSFMEQNEVKTRP